MKINGELGKVLSTSPEHRQWNCGMGIFKPGVVYWEENPEGRVIIDGKRCKIIKKSDALVNLYKVTKAKTLRFLFENSDYDPVVDNIGTGGTWEKKTEFSFAGNVWDWTRSNNSFSNVFKDAFSDPNNHVYIIATGDMSTITSTGYMFANCSSLTSVPLFDMVANMDTGAMFYNCTSLTSVPLFDTSNVTNMNSMLRNCTSLTNVPLFDTSNVTNMGYMLSNCTKVEGGALALYQQASGQVNPPTVYTNCFQYCGRDTVTGAAELAQIPSAWGGTAE